MKEYEVKLKNSIEVYKWVTIKAHNEEEAKSKALKLSGKLMFSNMRKLKLQNDMSYWGYSKLKEVK